MSTGVSGDTDLAPAVVRPSTTRARHAAHTLALLREPGWSLTLLGVLALSVVFVLLGRWQYGRHETKVLRNERVDANYTAAPVPLGQVLETPRSRFPVAEQWRPVTVTGSYEASSTVLVRNRPLDGVYGYEVIVPLRLANSGVLLVDRGWVPSGETGAEPDAVPPPPSGQVSVVVRLRPSEPGLSRDPPPGQELRIDIPRITSRLGADVYQAYGVLATETPGAPTAPALLPRPNEDLGPHFAYATQWWAFAVAAYVLFAHYLSREARGREGAPGADRDEASAPSGPRPSGPRPSGLRLSGLRPSGLRWSGPRSGRREPTDEEWEDAADP